MNDYIMNNGTMHHQVVIEFRPISTLDSLGMWKFTRQYPMITKLKNEAGGCYRAAFSSRSEELSQLCTLWKQIRKWAILRISKGEQQIDPAGMDAVVVCLEQRLHAKDPLFYCDGRTPGITARDENELFFPGCRYLIVDDQDYSDPFGFRWYHMGTLDAEGLFHVDKNGIMEKLQEISRQRFSLGCPLLDWEQIRLRVNTLPDTINPRRDGAWEYRWEEEQIVGICRTPLVRAGHGRKDMDRSVTSQRVDETRSVVDTNPSEVPKEVSRAADRPDAAEANSTNSTIPGTQEEIFQPVQPGQLTYNDIGGMKEQLRLIREAVELPLRYPDLIRTLNITPPKGVLLYGPPGCGKTLLAQVVANEVQASFFAVKGPEFLSSLHGQSEKRLRDLFAQAEQKAPSIIFFDEIDAFAFDRSRTTTSFEATLVAQFLSLMDGFDRRSQIVVIATTNRLDVLDKALLRPGRFDYRIRITVPSKEDREQILKLHTSKMPLEPGVDMTHLVEATEGFTGADIAALCAKAALMAASRALGPNMDHWPGTLSVEVMQSIRVTREDFTFALSQVQPSVTDDSEE
ncbi:AAA family ATPase [Heliobacterium chlorum]|uniref:AAA family ATPase n=1 Tax=Heliobacterium chlorum TaxID=2698 RepID=A0ABR7T0M0_HELCL|nr:AAA family ATPase [Heliobacterium chlorum]MBC9783840.1 AAA family ATPase [Heliobacterium chlorum]